MSKVRQYDFNNGAETATNPTAGTPTDASDLVTLTYLQTNYTSVTTVGAAVADIAALKDVSAADRADKQNRFVETSRMQFMFESSSAVAGDDYFVVAPTAGTGRWLNLTYRLQEFGADGLFLLLKNDSALSSDRTLTLNVNDASRTIEMNGDLTVGAAGATVSNVNNGDVTLATIGGTPNANAASLSAQALTLQPASASFGGVVTTAAQSFAGAKTLVNALNGTSADNATAGTGITLATPTTMNVRATSGSLVSVGGITAPTGIMWFVLHNVTGVTVGILNEDGASTAGNRILTGTATTVTMAINASLLFNYDLTTARWRIVGGSGGGGGGLTSSAVIRWTADSDAPLLTVEFNNEVYVYTDTADQSLYCTVKVPQGYTAGGQIFMYVNHYHQAASATQLLSAQATLIPIGTAFDNTTNQRTTTNTAQTGATKVICRSSLDLTDSSGQINAVAIAAGDLIRVRLYRGTDTSTSDLSMIPSSTEVKFG